MSDSTSLISPDVDDLIGIFNRLFAVTEQTQLIAGGDEPLYQPASSATDYHQIIFTKDYFSSALHEIAHWCIAGRERRQMLDYGYWYAPDGRTVEQQHAFAQVEVKPQALEWVLSEVCGQKFFISEDNLQGNISSDQQSKFKQAVVKQAQSYWQTGLPPRASVLNRALIDYYSSSDRLGRHLFTIERL